MNKDSLIYKRETWEQIKKEINSYKSPYLREGESPFISASKTYCALRKTYNIPLQKLRNKFLNKHQSLSKLFSHEISIDNLGISFTLLKNNYDDKDRALQKSTESKFVDWCINNIEKQ